jgi:hypothetical protein
MPTGPRRLVVAVAACAMLAACGQDGPVQPGRGRIAGPHGPAAALNPACDGALGGQTHAETAVTAPVIWTRANNPHRVDAQILVSGAGRVTLEPGVVVCFGGAGTLIMRAGGRLAADGFDTARIVLTAADPAAGWWGLRFSGSPAAAGSLKNVRLEQIAIDSLAVASFDSSAVVIDSSVFRQGGGGLYLMGRGSSISRSRVDTTTAAGSAAVTLGNLGHFESTVIRGAAGVGLAVYGTNGVYLLGGRIEGSGGVGLVVTTTGPGIVATRPIRVVGGASYPAELVVSAFPRIYPARADQDSLLGNARDTLTVTGGILQAFAYPKQALPWHVTGDITVQYFGILNPGPGASLFFDPLVRLTATNGGRVVAHGTPAAPVVFTGSSWGGITVDGAPALGSYLTNVRIEHSLGVGVLAGGSHTLVIDSAVFRQNGTAAWLWSANSRISRSRVDSTWGGSPAVLLTGYNSSIESTLIRASAGVGLAVATSTAHVLSCEVRDGAQDGIHLWDAGIEVHNCNLVNNAGVGISMEDPSSPANGEDDWWGDAAGPTGPSGDGAGPSVDYTPWRTTPYVLPYVP